MAIDYSSSRHAAVNDTAGAVRRRRPCTLVEQAKQVSSALSKLDIKGIRVKAVRFGRGYAKPLIEVVGHAAAPELNWYRYAWDRDQQGYYYRYATPFDDCQLQKEVRHE